MPNNQGTLIISTIRPWSDADFFPVALGNELFGVEHIVDDLTGRDAIPSEHRSDGMPCYIRSLQVVHRLIGGVTNGDWVDVSAGGASVMISKTYLQLKADKDVNILVPGQLYRITDFQTTHQIPGTAVIHNETSEPLLVRAVANNKLSTVAISETYPQDLIHYDFDDILAEDASTARTGHILYREDQGKRVATFYDFRGVVFRRYNYVLSGTNTGLADGYVGWSTSLTFRTISLSAESSGTDFNDVYTFNDDKGADGFKNVYLASPWTDHVNTVYSKDTQYNNVTFGTPTVSPAEISNNLFEGVALDSHIVLDLFNNNKVQGDFVGNLLGNAKFQDNFIKREFRNSIVGGTEFSKNTFETSWHDVIVESLTTFTKNSVLGAAFDNATIATTVSYSGSMIHRSVSNKTYSTNYSNRFSVDVVDVDLLSVEGYDFDIGLTPADGDVLSYHNASGTIKLLPLGDAIAGTNNSTFYIGGASTGVRIKKENTDHLSVRTIGDDDYGDLTVRDLNVMGTQTIINSEIVEIADNELVLNSNFTVGSPTEDGGIRIRRGDSTDARFQWNEVGDYWETGLVGSEVRILTDDDAAFSKFDTYNIRSRTGIKGQGQVTLTNGANTITGVGSDFNASTFTSLDTWATLMVVDSGGVMHRAFSVIVTSVTAATSAVWWDETGVQSGWDTGEATTYQGVSGTYDYYLVENYTDIPTATEGFATAINLNSYAGNKSFSGGNNAVAVNSSFSWGDFTASTGLNSTSLGNNARALGDYSVAVSSMTIVDGDYGFGGGQGFGNYVTGGGSKWIYASGISSFNWSTNTTLQTAGHGALANYSAILGGYDHNIPADSPGVVILGGNGIKALATTPDTVYVPNLIVDGTGNVTLSTSSSYFGWDSSNYITLGGGFNWTVVLGGFTRLNIGYSRSSFGASTGGPSFYHTTPVAGTPTYSFFGDTDTGFAWKSADNAGIYTGGVEALNIDATQFVSIPAGLGINGAVATSTVPLNVSLATNGTESVRISNLYIKQPSVSDSEISQNWNYGHLKFKSTQGSSDSSYIELHGVTYGGVDIYGGTILADDVVTAINITGPNAFLTAVTNTEGGHVIIDGGLKATAGTSDGDVLIATQRGALKTNTVVFLNQGAGADPSLTSNWATQFITVNGGLRSSVSSASWNLLNEVPSSTNPNIIPNGNSPTSGIGGAAGEVSVITGGVEGIKVATDAYVTMPLGLGINGATATSAIPLNVSLATTESVRFGGLDIIKTSEGHTLDGNEGVIKIVADEANFDENMLLLYNVKHTTAAASFLLGNVNGGVDIDVAPGNSKIEGANSWTGATTLANASGGDISIVAGSGSDGDTNLIDGIGGNIIIDGGSGANAGAYGNVLLATQRGLTIIGDTTNADITSILQVDPDTDATTILGRSKFHSASTDFAMFSHYDMSGTGDFSVRASSAGSTAINAATGTQIDFLINASTQWTINSIGNFVGSGISTIRTSTGNDSLIMYGGSGTTDARLILYGRSTVNGFSLTGGEVNSDLEVVASELQGRSAFSSAVTNQDGGDIVIDGGVKADAGGLQGNVLLSTKRGITVVGDTTNTSSSIIFQVDPDTDTEVLMGRTIISSIFTDSMVLAHIGNNTITDYSLRHTNQGTSVLNSAAGKEIQFRLGNVEQWKIGTTGDLIGAAGTTLILGSKIDPDPVGSNGMMYYNGTNNKFRVFENSVWIDMVGSGGGSSVGTLGAVQVSDGSSGFTDTISSSTPDATILMDMTSITRGYLILEGYKGAGSGGIGVGAGIKIKGENNLDVIEDVFKLDAYVSEITGSASSDVIFSALSEGSSWDFITAEGDDPQGNKRVTTVVGQTSFLLSEISASFNLTNSSVNIITHTTASTSVQTMLQLQRTTTPTAVDDGGLGIVFGYPDDGGQDTQSHLQVISDDVSAGSEDTRFNFKVYAAGTQKDIFSFGGAYDPFATKEYFDFKLGDRDFSFYNDLLVDFKASTNAMFVISKSASTNTVEHKMYVSRYTASGTPGTGHGTGIRFQLYNSTLANVFDAASIDTVWTTATAGSAQSKLVFDGVVNNTAYTQLLSLEDGAVTMTEVLTAPTTDTTGFGHLYIDTDAALKFRDETGTVSSLSGGGGTIGGSITTDQIAVGAVTSDNIEGTSALTFSDSGGSQLRVIGTSSDYAQLWASQTGTGDAYLRAGSTVGDAYVTFGIGATTRHYAFGIDDSDSDKLKITTITAAGAVTPSTGTELLTVTTAGVITTVDDVYLKDAKNISFGTTLNTDFLLGFSTNGILNMRAEANFLMQDDGTTEFTFDLSSTGTGDATANDWISTSDRRLKTKIEPLESWRARIVKLSKMAVTYERIKSPGILKIGWIAQDMETVAPEYVTFNNETQLYGINYAKFVTPIIQVVGENVEKIAVLEDEVTKLKAKVAAQDKQIKRTNPK